MTSQSVARLGVDIGGTFTDVALEIGERRFTAKGLTTPRAPEDGVLAALRSVSPRLASQPGEVSLIIHGTTLATNALIERKGAKTALLTTEGFRDVVEIRHENRFEQYDLNIDLPPPLVPRRLRLPIRERIDAQGDVLLPLDEASITRAIDVLEAQKATRLRSGCFTASPIPIMSAGSARRSRRRLPRDRRDAVLRRLAGDAGVRALLHRLRQCVSPAVDGPLSHEARARRHGRGSRARSC